jgi:hypothetical protein
MDGIALSLLLIAEFTFVLWLRGLSIRAYLAARDPIAPTIYYVMLWVLAVMPLLVARRHDQLSVCSQEHGPDAKRQTC